MREILPGRMKCPGGWDFVEYRWQVRLLPVFVEQLDLAFEYSRFRQLRQVADREPADFHGLGGAGFAVGFEVAEEK